MHHRERSEPGNDVTRTSLVSNRVSLQDCGGGGALVLRSESTGAYAPMPCQRNWCVTCGSRKVVASAIAAGLAEPDQFGTLTLVGEDPRIIRRRISSLRADLGKRGFPGEWFGAVEANPKGTGHHWHFWRRGGYVPQRLLSDRASAWGMGYICDIRQYRGGAKGVIYGTKTARGSTTYGIKSGLDTEGLAGFLELHGGRYGIWSRAYFGRPYREAVRDALTLSDREGHDPGPWHVVNVATMYQDRLRARRQVMVESVGGSD